MYYSLYSYDNLSDFHFFSYLHFSHTNFTKFIFLRWLLILEFFRSHVFFMVLTLCWTPWSPTQIYVPQPRCEGPLASVSVVRFQTLAVSFLPPKSGLWWSKTCLLLGEVHIQCRRIWAWRLNHPSLELFWRVISLPELPTELAEGFVETVSQLCHLPLLGCASFPPPISADPYNTPS